MALPEIISVVWKRRWLALLGIAVVIALGYVLTPIVLGPKVPVYAVAQSELVQTVVASGRVMNPLRVEIGSQITGTVSNIPVAEGQTVKAGQTLITLEAEELRAAVEQARSAVGQAEARVRQIRDVGLPAAEQALRQAEANLIDTKKQYQRTKGLHEKGFVGQAQLDDAQKNLDVGESQVRSARLQVEDNRPEGSGSRLAEMALSQARASLQAASATFEHSTIKAAVDGTLIDRNVERGDVVQPGKVLMVLSPAGETQLVVQIDEKNLAALALGQKALASTDAYPQDKFAVELVYINPGVDPQRGSVEVKLRVPSPPSYLRQDMTVSVDIEVARRANTLVLPTEAVRDLATDKPWVMKVNDSRAHRQAIKVGARGGNRIEVVEGLEAGDRVLAASGVSVTEGRRVRALLRE
jgi:HlyD family secretion protein